VTTSGHNLVNAFDMLPPAEQHEVAVEILRRSTPEDEIPIDALGELAAEVFRAYDEEEGSGRAKS
jgi:hypothetical protein